MHPYYFVGAAAIGVFAFIGLSIYNAFADSRQSNYHYEKKKDKPFQIPPHHVNLTCPFCGKGIKSSDSQLSCGHMCHASCYLQLPVAYRYCRFYHGLNENIEDIPSYSNTNLRRRVSSVSHTARKSEIPHSVGHNKSDVPLKTKNVPEQVPAASPTDAPMECGFCDIPLKFSEAVRMPCHHNVHFQCHEIFKNVMKCSKCPEPESWDKYD